jgi:hypothetical protein
MKLGTYEMARLLLGAQSILRVLAIPCITAYGLYLVRPKETNFLLYLDERRRFEKDFDAMFSAPAPAAAAPASTKAKGAETKSKKSKSGTKDPEQTPVAAKRSTVDDPLNLLLDGGATNTAGAAASPTDNATTGGHSQNKVLPVASASSPLLARYKLNPLVKVDFHEGTLYGVGTVEFLQPQYRENSLKCYSFTHHIWRCSPWLPTDTPTAAAASN